MIKAKIIKFKTDSGNDTSAVVRGQLNDGYKHWGMRSNIKFRKKLSDRT